jgi:hypothetical protein
MAQKLSFRALLQTALLIIGFATALPAVGHCDDTSAEADSFLPQEVQFKLCESDHAWRMGNARRNWDSSTKKQKDAICKSEVQDGQFYVSENGAKLCDIDVKSGMYTLNNRDLLLCRQAVAGKKFSSVFLTNLYHDDSRLMGSRVCRFRDAACWNSIANAYFDKSVFAFFTTPSTFHYSLYEENPKRALDLIKNKMFNDQQREALTMCRNLNCAALVLESGTDTPASIGAANAL